MSFANFNPQAWGYNQVQQNYQMMSDQQQYANLPAALLSTLKREKKPFTYTPGGVNLSEVLNARLQKRMERKKKYQEENPKQVVVSPTYNSPLDMYSVENALEALEVQAKLATSRSPESSYCTLPRNYKFRCQDEETDPIVAQSNAFRMLQIMTDTESQTDKKLRGPGNTEMRFTGIREGRSTIPSKFFQTLQKITGTEAEEDDEPEIPRYEKRTTTITTRTPQPVPLHQPVPKMQQQQQTFGIPPTLKRPAAFLPKQQMRYMTTAGTDF